MGTSEWVPNVGLQERSPETPRQATRVGSVVQHPNQAALGLPSLVGITLKKKPQLSRIRRGVGWKRSSSSVQEHRVLLAVTVSDCHLVPCKNSVAKTFRY